MRRRLPSSAEAHLVPRSASNIASVTENQYHRVGFPSPAIARRGVLGGLAAALGIGAAVNTGVAVARVRSPAPMTFHEIMIVELLPPAGSHSDTWSGLGMNGSGQRWAFSADRTGEVHHCFAEVRDLDIPPGDTYWRSANREVPDALRVSVRRAIATATEAMGLSLHDPIFAMIERHKEAWAAYVAACESAELEGAAHDAATRQAGFEHGEILIDLVSTVPTTLVGCAALLHYVDVVVEQTEQGHLFEEFRGMEEPSRALLTRIANVINAIVVRPAAATVALAAAFLPEDRDAVLMGLGGQFEAAVSAYREVAARYDAATDEPDGDDGPTGRELNAACARVGAIINSIAPLKAHTLAGLVVKARCVSYCWDGQPHDLFKTDQQLSHSIVIDLLRFGPQGGAS